VKVLQRENGWKEVAKAKFESYMNNRVQWEMGAGRKSQLFGK